MSVQFGLSVSGSLLEICPPVSLTRGRNSIARGKIVKPKEKSFSNIESENRNRREAFGLNIFWTPPVLVRFGLSVSCLLLEIFTPVSLTGGRNSITRGKNSQTLREMFQ